MAALKKAFVTTETYATDWENFYVDITTFESRFGKEFEAHIYHRDYDTKMHMFGALYEHESDESFLEMVEGLVDDYVLIYKERFCREESN